MMTATHHTTDTIGKMAAKTQHVYEDLGTVMLERGEDESELTEEHERLAKAWQSIIRHLERGQCADAADICRDIMESDILPSERLRFGRALLMILECR